MTAAHRKHIKENRGGRDDRPAGTPGATKLPYSRARELGFTGRAPTRRTKFPLGKPLVVAMTEGRIAANAKADAERRFAEDWHKVSGLIYIHPCDFHIGMDVHWHRKGRVLHGTVVTVNEDMLRPVKVLGKRIQDRQYHYTPSVYDFCDKDGRKPCVCDLPIGRRTECQHKPHCPIPDIDKALYGTPDVLGPPRLAVVDQVKGDKRWYVRVGGLDQARFQSKGEAEIWADGWNAALGIAEPGVKLMQGHSPMVLAGVFHNPTIKPDMAIQGSLMGPDEYALRKLPKLRKKK